MRTSWIFLATIFGACGSELPPGAPLVTAPDAGPAAEGTSRYLPLELGAVWNLHETDPATGASADKLTTVEAYEDVGSSHPGKKSFRVRVEKLAGHTMYWEGYEGDITVRYRNDDYDLLGNLVDRQILTPYRLKLDETPAHLVTGATYSESFVETTVDGTGATPRAKVEDWLVVASSETVTTPMGTFTSALHVRRVSGSGKKLKDYWYVRGIGKVKEDGSDKQVEELISHTTP